MTVDGRVTIPASVGPLDQGPGRAVLAHELVHLQQQRTLGDAMPPAGSESAHRLEAAARTAEAHASWHELSLARPLSRSVSDTPSVAVTRPVGVPNTSLHTTMQMAEGDPPPPAADSTGTSTAVGGTPQGSAASAGAGGLATQLGDRDMDELLRKLYPRLRRHLSSELLVARERAGVLADLR